MEQKIRYQYTYFVMPYAVSDYEKYILKLVKDKNISLKIFEKEKDLDIYTHFMPGTKEYFFPSFELEKENINALEQMDDRLKASTLSKMSSIHFEYKIEQTMQGKMGEEAGLFFHMTKAEIICFETGICFLLLKTHMDNSESFADLLNFNYKFSDITTTELKELEKINLQNSTFENNLEIAKFIENLTGKEKASQRLYVCSYACVDAENWDNEETLKDSYTKQINVLPSTYNAEYGSTYNDIMQNKNAKLGITKSGMGLYASSVDNYNYTKLPYYYENKYIYTLIIRLYQKEYMNSIIQNKENIKTLKQRYHIFQNKIFRPEVTKDEIGTQLYKEAENVFELQPLLEQTKEMYELTCQEQTLEKEKKTNQILMALLGVSVILNIVNFIAIIKFII